jgi:hypothetical protein
MGRGRAKAKQTKVARALKYQSPDMDLDRLRQDLGGSENENDEFSDDDEFDPYAVDEDEDGTAGRRAR